MSEDIFRELQQFQQYAENLQRLMSDMHDRVPQSSEGTDPQGAVSVTLGADGLPESIKIASDWQRRRAVGDLGSAVVEAFESAMSDRLERWSRSLEQSGWEARAEQLDDGLASSASTAPARPFPEISDHDVRYVLRRPLDESIEDALTALDAVDQLDANAFLPPEVTGDSAARRVTITVTAHALVSCEVDPQWAAGQSTVRLNQALNEALNDARGKLGSAESPGAAGVANLHADGLMNEFLAMIKDPQRFLD
ncbi:YbaB/EbfC family nucleoid-associated protein [Streptomyces luomodiensis]|uniref:YbaB/EbfC family nucleoid-associated protein n=1 Tax=Streptomyces luomodiensis TaxID=3026192 RepID=A0ABY9V931_9ACTN|nr:YbaB/EbfC family nucleoid-associated protein [Streptomyces sp. SCA4-21]WNE99220.1 YbaB/EbfC family nucleoid-associated protein [Streptomyces sp. SCA4-21]